MCIQYTYIEDKAKYPNVKQVRDWQTLSHYQKGVQQYQCVIHAHISKHLCMMTYFVFWIETDTDIFFSGDMQKIWKVCKVENF